MGRNLGHASAAEIRDRSSDPPGRGAHDLGVAWSDGTPLDRVELQVDNGSWSPAELDRPNDPYSWTFFSLEIPTPSDGEHTLVSRAIDRAGRTQPENLDMKRTRWENNELFGRTILV